MKWTAAISASLALALGFWLGRATAPNPESELASVDSFKRSLEDPDWLTRSYRFSSFLVGLNPENLPAALEAIEPQLPWLLTDEFRAFMLAWSRFDPAGAFAQARAWPLQVRRNAGGAAMYAWGFRNPLEAVRELSRVEDGDLKEFWAARLLAGWAHGEYRDTASEYIAKLPAGPTREAYLASLAWEISKEGPEALKRWVESVPDDPPRFKEAVFVKAIGMLAGIDAPAAARWMEEQLDREGARDALMALAGPWATSDGPSAMDWLTGLPEGRDRDAAVRTGFRVWFNHAPNDAEQWLRAVTPERAVDPAVRFLVERSREEKPAASRWWASRLTS